MSNLGEESLLSNKCHIDTVLHILSVLRDVRNKNRVITHPTYGEYVVDIFTNQYKKKQAHTEWRHCVELCSANFPEGQKEWTIL